MRIEAGEKRPEVYLPQIGVQKLIQYMPMMEHGSGMQSLEHSRKVVKRLICFFLEHVSIILIYDCIYFFGLNVVGQ